MAYPATLDSFLKAVSQFSTKSLVCTLNGTHDSSTTTFLLNEDPIAQGLAAADGLVVIEDEHIRYAAANAAAKSLTGCTRAYGGTVASTHPTGAAVVARATHSFVQELGDALVNVETALGLTGSLKYLRVVDGVSQSVDGIKTFSGAIALGASPAQSGLLRLPNNAPIFGRNAANAADLALVKLNVSNEVEIGQIARFAAAAFLAADPTAALHAATKQYTDAQRDTRVAKAGDTMTGALTLSADPTSPLHATTKSYADKKVAKTGDIMTGLLTVGIDDAAASGVATIAQLRHTTSGTPAAGIGGRLLLESESADENPAAVAAIDWVLDDATAGSEDSSLRFLTRVAGGASLTEGMRLVGVNLGIGATPPLSNAWQGTTPVLTIAGIASGQAVLEMAGSRTIDNPIAEIGFLNEAIGGADDRIAQISARRVGANNSGELRIFTWAAGVAHSSLTAHSSSGVYVGDAPADPGANNLRVQGAIGVRATPASSEALRIFLASGVGASIGPAAISNDGSVALFVGPAATTQRGLIVRGIASQTAVSLSIEDSAGLPLVNFYPSGGVYIGTSVVDPGVNNLRVQGKIGIDTGSFVAKLDIKAGATVTGFRIEHAGAGEVAFSSFVTADSFLRFSFLTDGTMKWGPGSAAADIQARRSGTRTLVIEPIGGDVVGMFRVLTSGGSDVLAVDTSNTRLGIGVGAPASRLDLGAGAIELLEMTAPANGGANSARLFARDNGAGKSQLCVIFNTGAIQVLATEP